MSEDNKKLAHMFKTQQSLTEWLDDINHDKAEELRVEDNDKRERLKAINRITGLPFDEPVQFSAIDLAEKSDALVAYLTKAGEQSCALRLIPLEDGLPKLRMRGLSVADAYEWFKEQDIEPAKYRADFVPNETCTYSTIFVVNQHGIYGEIIEGGHHQLTQGFHEKDTPITFQFDFTDWQLSRDDDRALSELKKLTNHLLVTNEEHKEELTTTLNVEFAGDYIVGYFEATDSDDFGVMFKDFNQTLGKMYAAAQMREMDTTSLLNGQVGSPGSATGPVQLVAQEEVGSAEFADGAILVCEVTTPDYVPIMRKAAAIITDQGGILSHAAIVARELGVPCIVGTGSATTTLSNGQKITVDADNGKITIA